MQEIELVKLLQQKNEQAFNHFVQANKNLVYNTVLSVVQNMEEAEDVAQEVFIQVYQSIQAFKGDCKLTTWLYRICLNKAIDFTRSKKAKKRFSTLKNIFFYSSTTENEAIDFHHPGVALHNKETAAMLFKAINTLPENQKKAFILIKIEKLSYAEVSEVLNTTIKGIEGLIHRANISLKQQLNTYYNQ